jgi:hypothetical protein
MIRNEKIGMVRYYENWFVDSKAKRAAADFNI